MPMDHSDNTRPKVDHQTNRSSNDYIDPVQESKPEIEPIVHKILVNKRM